MTKLSLLLSVSISLLAGCAASEPDTTASTKDTITKSGETKPAASPELPSVCTATGEDACLAGTGCAWGDQGDGPECFFVGDVDAQPVPPELPGATPVPSPPGATPVPSPSVCSHNTTESSCLDETGCAWGDQGHGPECFFVGNVVPFGN